MIFRRYKYLYENIILFILIAYAYYSSILAGVSWDEIFVLNRGEERLKYLYSLGNSKVTFEGNEFFPGINDVLAVFFIQLFPKNFKYEMLHIFNCTISILTLFGTYQLFKILFNKKVSKIIFILLFLNPIFYSHMSINSKDTVITFSFVWLLLYFIKYMKNQLIIPKRRKIFSKLLIFTVIGLGTRIHFISLLILFIPFFVNYVFIQKKDFSFKILLIDILKILPITYFILIIFWPHTHSNIFLEPIRLFFESLNVRAGPPTIFLNNEVVDTLHVGSFFFFENLIFRSPLFILFLYIIFIFILFNDYKYFSKLFKNFNFNILSILIIIIFPPILILSLNIPQYDGIRYYLFILPFFTAIPALVVTYIYDNFKSNYFKLLSIFLVYFFLVYLYNFLHFNPYQYSYVNNLVIDKYKIPKKFENDYWGISMKQLIKQGVKSQFLANDQKQINVGVCGFNIDIIKLELKKYRNINFKIVFYGDDNVDYIIANNRSHYRIISENKTTWHSCYDKITSDNYVSIKKGNIELSRLYKIN